MWQKVLIFLNLPVQNICTVQRKQINKKILMDEEEGIN
jgi:hypothetical protein